MPMFIPANIKSLIVFSPHLDDAVLSCTDHIIELKNSGIQIKIVTIFTKFKADYISTDAVEYVNKCGMSDIGEFEIQRSKEDLAAMRFLNLEYEHLGLVDAGFRGDTKPIYSSFNSLFSGKIADSDHVIIDKLQKIFEQYKKPNTMYFVPFGMGNHADHLLVKEAAQKVFSHKHLFSYLEFPYALNRRNWKLITFFKLITSKHTSIKMMSHTKKSAVNLYTSQLPVLFPKKTHYLELIFGS